MAIGDVIIRDLGYDEYVHKVNQLEQMIVKAGFPEGVEVAPPESSSKEGVYDMSEMIYRAMIHEFGLGNVPERSFIRPALDENRLQVDRTLELLYDRVATGKMTPEQAMNALGSFAVGLIRKKMREGPFQELAQSTIDRKGSSTPLVDTGQMKQTVQFVITGKNA